jgi:hypothetical protein
MGGDQIVVPFPRDGASEEWRARTFGPSACSAFIERVASPSRRDAGGPRYDVTAALDSGAIVMLASGPRKAPLDKARFIPASWLPPRPERGGVAPWY